MIDIILNEKKTSVSIRYNAYYKLVILLGIIKYCGKGHKANLQLIHLIFWALRDMKNYQVLYDLKMDLRKTLTPWSFEYGIEKVLGIGYIEEYIGKKIVDNKLEIVLTTKGEVLINSINTNEFFTDEIEKLKMLGNIPKTRLESANSNWKLI